MCVYIYFTGSHIYIFQSVLLPCVHLGALQSMNKQTVYFLCTLPFCVSGIAGSNNEIDVLLLVCLCVHREENLLFLLYKPLWVLCAGNTIITCFCGKTFQQFLVVETVWHVSFPTVPPP